MRGADVLRQLWRSGSGRAGVALLAFMTAVSVWVLFAFPANFGNRVWSNPSYWADNPKAVPPAWVGWLPGSRAVEHRVLDLEPADGTNIYEARWTHSGKRPPTFLSFSLGKMTFYERAPQYSVVLQRPDGKSVVLLRQVVRGPRPGETAPYVRFEDAPNRLLLTGDPAVGDAVADWVAQEYGVPRPDGRRVGFVQEALFGTPVEGEPDRFTGLAGEYRLQVQVIAGSRDTIDQMRFVSGGTAFGVMGTDALGRDLAQGLVYGVPVALIIGLGAALLTSLIGAALGIASGYLGGWADTLIQRMADIVSNVPVLPLLIFLVFILGSKLFLIVLVLVAFSWPGLTILLRSMVLQIRSGQLVEAAATLGASPWRIMARHIFPQMAPFIFAQLVFMVPGAILAESSLSFLGLGDPSIPTWGQILEAGFRTGGVYVGYWWWIGPPGLLIVFTAVTFILLALGMEQVMNPRLRSRAL